MAATNNECDLDDKIAEISDKNSTETAMDEDSVDSPKEDSTNVVQSSTDLPEDQVEMEEDGKAVSSGLPFKKMEVRRYENKFGGFVTGLDLISKDNQEKIQGRALRFGLKDTDMKTAITEEDIKVLYESLDIEDKVNRIRLDTIHLRGTNNMSTDNIFEYFTEYAPSSVEWINDTSCNVLWVENGGASRALLGLSRPIMRLDKLLKEDAEDENVVLMQTEDDDGEDEGEKPKAKEEEVKNKEIDIEIVYPENSHHHTVVEVDLSKIGVAVPPGKWRLGKPYAKSKLLLMRFAFKNDKKLPGAEKRSQYYLKYGNPNYGGLKGLITVSKKKQIRDTKVGITTSGNDANKRKRDEEEEDSDGDSNALKRSRQPRMRMYADDEEVKIAERLERASSKPSVSKSKDLRSKITGRAAPLTIFAQPDSDEDEPEEIRRPPRRDEDDWRRRREEDNRKSFSSNSKREEFSRSVTRKVETGDLRRRLSNKREHLHPLDRKKANPVRSVVSAGRNKFRTPSPSENSESMSEGSKSSGSSSSSSDDDEATDLRGKLDRLKKSKKLPFHTSPLLIQVKQTNIRSRLD